MTKPNCHTDLKSFEAYAHTDFQSALGVDQVHRMLHFHLLRAFYNSFHRPQVDVIAQAPLHIDAVILECQTNDEIRKEFGGLSDDENEYS